jgi:hypothetical protein
MTFTSFQFVQLSSASAACPQVAECAAVPVSKIARRRVSNRIAVKRFW